MRIKIDKPPSNNKKVCPVDKTELTIDRANSALQCSECHRVYYSNMDYDAKQSEAFDEYGNDDIETASSISSNGPLLISSKNEMSDFALQPVGGGESPYDKVIKSKYGNDAKITTINY